MVTAVAAVQVCKSLRIFVCMYGTVLVYMHVIAQDGTV